MKKKMKKYKITQKNLAFYKLYKAHKENPEQYIPTWAFGGEIRVEELNRWELMTYKAPTRLTDLFKENPGLFQRRMVRGKSGSHYYEYRISLERSVDKMLDKQLVEFYQKIRKPVLPIKSIE